MAFPQSLAAAMFSRMDFSNEVASGFTEDALCTPFKKKAATFTDTGDFFAVSGYTPTVGDKLRVAGYTGAGVAYPVGTVVYVETAPSPGPGTNFTVNKVKGAGAAVFAAGDTISHFTVFHQIENVREFPAMGTPANIVNVPVYGQKTSQTIQGQADAPQLELTINYIAAEWAASAMGRFVNDGDLKTFRFTSLDEAPAATAALNSETNGFGASVTNASYYWLGKIEAIQVTPNLTDSSTATLTLSIQSDFYGAYTV